MTKPENRTAEGRFVKGQSGNAGGRSKKQREIEAMLDVEFRSVENFRDELRQARALAFRGQKGDSAYLKVYWDRVWGPAQSRDLDLSDAPPEVLEYVKGLVQ